MNAISIRHIAPAFRSYAGEEALAAIGKELDRARSERVVLICGASMVRNSEVLGSVESAVGERLIGRFSGVREHSPVNSVDAAAQYLREQEADAVVALGGGSAIVTARAAIIRSAENRPVKELATRREDGRMISPRLTAPKIPLFIVPSTPTTAYAKAGAAVRDLDTGERLALFDPKTRAAAVFMHPSVAETAPAGLARGSALNAFSMAVDGLQANAGDPMAEANMRHALRMLNEWLPRVVEPLEGNVGVQLMLAALLVGQASDHVGAGLAQPLAHALGPRSTASNGVVEALMLPHTMRFNLGHTDSGLASVAQALDPAGSGDPDAAIRSVEATLREIEVPTRLQEVGVDPQSFESVADDVLDDWSSTTVPRPATKDEVISLLNAAW